MPGFSIEGDPDDQSEDCLSLNVWTPGDDRRRPVMVWVHGGSFISGTGASLLYRGHRLAARGDVVVVTLNYRLGALGFLAHPALVDGDPHPQAVGNWGLLDVVAALRWVRDHIATFGGDPDQVTVFGESAGAMGLAALMGAPKARGLFHRAILQSGGVYTHSPARAAQAAGQLVRQLGLDEVDRDRLVDVPAAELVAALSAIQTPTPPPGELPIPLLPTVDGCFLPESPRQAIEAGAMAGVPLMLGTNRDELSMMALGDPRFAGMDDDDLLAWAAYATPDVDAPTVVAAYRRARARRGQPTDPPALWVAIGTDVVFRWPTLRLAAAQQAHQPATYVYLFTYETPVFGGVLGACHALEIPFVFGSVRRPEVSRFSGGGPEAEALSDDMIDAWTAFARTGDPSVAGAPWPAWDPVERSTMVWGPSGGAAVAPDDEELSVWAAHDPLVAERDRPFTEPPAAAAGRS
jgi:para-nitrobenzyl esterase